MRSAGQPVLQSAWICVGVAFFVTALMAFIAWLVLAILTWEPAYPV